MSILRFNIPNILTFSRIIFVPIFIWITPQSHILGIIIFLIASLTDFLDGYLARKSRQITKLGIILDPIADKILIISALILLVDMVRISAWIAIVIIAREFIITVIRLIGLSKNIIIPAEKYGKLKVITQIVAVILLLLPGGLVYFDFYDIGLVIIYISAIIAILSGIKYIVSFWRQIP